MPKNIGSRPGSIRSSPSIQPQRRRTNRHGITGSTWESKKKRTAAIFPDASARTAIFSISSRVPRTPQARQSGSALNVVWQDLQYQRLTSIPSGSTRS